MWVAGFAKSIIPTALKNLVMLVRVHLVGDCAPHQSTLGEPGEGALGGTIDQLVRLRKIVRRPE